MHLARHARGAGKRTSRCRDDEPSPAGVSLRATLREPASPRCLQNGPTYNAGRPPLEEPLWAAPPTAGPSPPARMLPARVASTLSGAGGCRPELCPGGQGCCACLAYAQQTKAGATRQRWQVSEPQRGVGAPAQACGAPRAVACWTPAHAMNVSQQRMQAHAHAARVARQSMRVLHMSLRGRRAGKRGRPRQQGGSARSAERGPRTLYSASAAFPSVQATCMCDEFAETAQVGADLARA